MIKKAARHLLAKLGYTVTKTPQAKSPDGLYRPLYSPWHSNAFDKYFSIASPRTLVSRDRCYVLERLLKHTLNVSGEVVECGVYRGGTAAMLAQILVETDSEKKLYLFDTFQGMPETDEEKDWHKKGDFADTSLDAVKQFVGHPDHCIYKPGFIPNTFSGLDDLVISFCHIDVDIYKSIIDSLNFIWPRISQGGVVIFDDYGFPTCPGALEAVDLFFSGKDVVPLCLQTGQALVFKK